MSTHVLGFKPPDEKWKKMKAIWDSCQAAGIDPPQEVEKFFDYCDPDPNGVEVKIEATEWRDNAREGYEIDVSKLPKDVTILRFYNSW
jgi:hypothetical protein